jgi:hypothetical protein
VCHPLPRLTPFLSAVESKSEVGLIRKESVAIGTPLLDENASVGTEADPRSGGGSEMPQGLRRRLVRSAIVGFGITLVCGTSGCLGTDKPNHPASKLLGKTQQPGPGLPGTPILPGTPNPTGKTAALSQQQQNPYQPSLTSTGAIGGISASSALGTSANQQPIGTGPIAPSVSPIGTNSQLAPSPTMPPQPNWSNPPSSNILDSNRRGDMPQVPLTDIYPPAPPSGSVNNSAPTPPIAPPIAPPGKGY